MNDIVAVFIVVVVGGGGGVDNIHVVVGVEVDFAARKDENHPNVEPKDNAHGNRNQHLVGRDGGS